MRGFLRRFYYSNKARIWGIVLFIIFVLMVLRVVNFMVEKNNQKNSNDINLLRSETSSNSTTINNNSVVTREKSLVTGEIMDINAIKSANNLIDQFVTACNNKELEKAYSLISEECKQENFKSIEDFKDLYYMPNFGGVTKTAEIENWFNNIYEIYYIEDMLSTGKIKDAKIRDYISIVQQNGESKLNIHSFIDKVEINKEQTFDNIIFKIISKNIYMDYETYTIQVQNKTNGAILLDTMQSTKSIFLQDTNSVKFYCYNNEIIKEFLKVNQNASTQLKIRFMRTYSSSTKDVSLVFSDIVLNYKGSISDNINRTKIIIDI